MAEPLLEFRRTLSQLAPSRYLKCNRLSGRLTQPDVLGQQDLVAYFERRRDALYSSFDDAAFRPVDVFIGWRLAGRVSSSM